MKKVILSLLLVGAVLVGCEKESEDNTSGLTINDLTTLSIDENSSNGTVIGTITANTENTSDVAVYTIESQTPSGAISLNGNQMVIADENIFDYEVNTEVTGELKVVLGEISETVGFSISINDIDENAQPTTFLDNTLRQVTGAVQDFEISHMYAQKWDNLFVAPDNTEGALKFDIRSPLNDKRLEIYFSGISSTNTNYISSAGSGSSNVKLESGEFVVNKISVGSNMNYWWSPNNQHTATLSISGDNVIVEIENFEIGGGIGSAGTETFNMKFEFSKSDYNSLSDNSLKLITFL